jgi:hypothetical protein
MESKGANNDTVRSYVIRHDYSVPSEFFKTILRIIREILPALWRDQPYTLELLCGPESWGLWTDGERRMAGRCMAHLVVSGQLPLRFAESRHEYPKKYRLK